MDIVITYVNGMDPVWQQDYMKYVNQDITEKRFRDWGTLKYLLRGIEINMPFIRNVYLVVSHESQVPQWVNRNNLHIVLHKDFVPAKYLPTFNCNTLEMNLHRIEGIDEEFLYFNDDIFPVASCTETDFFRNGKPVIYFSKHSLALNMYKQICRNSDRLAREVLGMPVSKTFVRQQHICAPMKKSSNDQLYEKIGDGIERSSTRIRTADNCNQYLFLDYQYYQGEVVNEKISCKHFSVSIATVRRLKRFILNPTRKLVCINDVHINQKRYEKLRTAILESFESRFPAKSKFEI